MLNKCRGQESQGLEDVGSVTKRSDSRVMKWMANVQGASKYAPRISWKQHPSIFSGKQWLFNITLDSLA